MRGWREGRRQGYFNELDLTSSPRLSERPSVSTQNSHAAALLIVFNDHSHAGPE